MMRLFICIVFVLLFQLFPQAVSAAGPAAPAAATAPASAAPASADDNDISDILDSMGYPELQVVPRASERLKMEAKAEASTWWAMHWPVQIAGLATVYAGTQAKGNRRSSLSEKDESDANTVTSLSTSVGIGWIVGGVILGAQRPYTNGARAISKINGKDERSMLLRERMAEEALERPAKVMRVLQHIAVGSTAILNGLNLHYSNEKGMVISGVAIMLSFLPYMFEDPTITVYDKHIEYKKKIYSPIKSVSFSVDPETNILTPMTTLAWHF